MLVVSVAGAAPSSARQSAASCDAIAASGPTSAVRQLETAICFDAIWKFHEVADHLALAVKILQAEAAAKPDAPPPSGAAMFAGGELPVPERRNAPMGQYPGTVVLRGVKGVVIVEAILDREGRVRTTRIVQSVPELDRYAVEFVRQSRYRPTIVKGAPVDVALYVPIRFGLPSEPTPGERAALALAYYREGRRSIAAQAAALALYHANRDVARIGRLASLKDILTVESGSITEPRRIHYVDPEYPSFAIRARVEGSVALSGIIDREGRVARVKVVRGINGLDAAAIDAVLQWRYEPSMLDGQPVTVLMSVVVNFRLR
jgi:TonB family protein